IVSMMGACFVCVMLNQNKNMERHCSMFFSKYIYYWKLAPIRANPIDTTMYAIAQMIEAFLDKRFVAKSIMPNTYALISVCKLKAPNIWLPLSKTFKLAIL